MNLSSAFGAFLDPVADKARARRGAARAQATQRNASPRPRAPPARAAPALTRARARPQLMVAAALVLLSTLAPPALAGAPRWLIPAPAIAIIGREITMSAFREWASAAGGDAHKACAVNNLGKWKTATQMAAITLLLGASAAGRHAGVAAAAGAVLLWASAGLALASLGVYMQGALPYLLK